MRLGHRRGAVGGSRHMNRVCVCVCASGPSRLRFEPTRDQELAFVSAQSVNLCKLKCEPSASLGDRLALFRTTNQRNTERSAPVRGEFALVLRVKTPPFASACHKQQKRQQLQHQQHLQHSTAAAAHRGANGSGDGGAAAGCLGALPPRAARRLLLGAPTHAAGGATARRRVSGAARLAIIHCRATRLIWSSCSASRQQLTGTMPASAIAQEASIAGSAKCAAREEGQRCTSVEPVPCLLPGRAC